ncbi:MAG: TIGR03560 family F420-dependent LLM class oxidoreductase [Dehalococcoidia bacterium]
MTRSAHFGVTVPQISRTWEEAKVAALDFERLGFDSLWVCDHLYGVPRPEIPILEAWTLLTALGAITERVELGTLVTPPGFRNPALLAKIVATLDRITNGRVVPGLGAGWFRQEFVGYGFDFPDTRDRLGRLAEAAELMTRAWSEPGLTFEGKHFHTDGLTIAPPPVRRPPLLIGGSGEKVTMRIAARFADIWNNLAGHQARLEHKVAVLREHCAAVGRDPDSIRVSQQCMVLIVRTEDEVEPLLQRAEKLFGGHMGDVRGPLAIAGTPDQVAERIQRHIDLGCSHFIIEFFGRDTRAPAALFAETVLPRFRSLSDVTGVSGRARTTRRRRWRTRQAVGRARPRVNATYGVPYGAAAAPSRRRPQAAAAGWKGTTPSRRWPHATVAASGRRGRRAHRGAWRRAESCPGR